MNTSSRLFRRIWLCGLLLVSAGLPVLGQAQTALPDWEQLSPAQRDALLAPLRERWNSAPPAQRQRMLEHGQRWQTMSPEQREQAQRGMRRFQGMSVEQRDNARALYAQMRTMTPAQRQQLRERWEKMSAQERRQWVQDNPPPSRER